MSASLSVEPRRSPASQKPPRDLPVLFHLMDVSRPKPGAKSLPAVRPAPSQEPPTAETELPNLDRPAAPETCSALPAQSDAPAATASLESRPSVAEPALPAPLAASAAAYAPPEFKPLILPVPPAESFSSAAMEADARPSLEVPAESPQEYRAEAAADAPSATADASPPEAADAPEATAELTPRTRSKTAGKSDWFTTHGKYIAIAFVIALLGTIVLARLNRRAVPTLAEPKHSHPGEAGHKLTATKPPSQATIVGQVSQDQAHAKTASGIQETSPAQLAEPQPHTDLHPPTIPQLAVRPNTESTPEQPKDESLFPWAKTDERVAARPEPPTIAPAQEAPITPVPPSGAPSPANPEIVPQYPVTATPEPVYPTAGPAAPPAPGAAYSAPGPAYPTTSTPNQYQFPAPAPAPTTQPASGPALAPPTGGSQYFPQDNSASGSRYERTGSGLY